MASVNYGLLIWIENAFYQIVGFVFLEVCVRANCGFVICHTLF